jgi:[acyl-carrier-protein] S-malonyltransferase
MQPAADKLADFLKGVEFRAPQWPRLVEREPATARRPPTKFRRAMVAQVVSSVRWTERRGRHGGGGHDRGCECAPGTVLAGLVKRIAPDVPIASIF